ncbi:MAG: hypothetical protein HHJ13_00075 [Phycicoccus sp.]|nr:hypothetical protein [Phycicoccus sp.]
MSAERLSLLQESHAFDPAPVRQELSDRHVPFDTMTPAPRCEQALDSALRRGQRVAVVGVSGAGKSSVTATVLGPLVEGLVPLPIPVSMEQPQVATDPVAFAAHIVRVVAHWVQTAQPKQAGSARQITNQTQPGQRVRRQRFSVTPEWLSAKLELSYELQQVAAENPPTSGQVLAQARQILDLIASEGLRPVLVLDDTDKWLNTAWQDNAVAVRAGFFGRVIRVIAEDLASAAAVAVHTEYLTDPDYQAAAGFLDATVRVPPVPDAAGVRRILARRAALALGDDISREATVLDGLIDDAAVEILYAHYAGGTPDLRRRILYVAHTALTLACDSGAEVMGPAHLDLAISEVTHD